MHSIMHALRSSAFRSLAVAITLFAMTLFLTGCNTVEGVGKDIQGAGEAIQDAAD